MPRVVIFRGRRKEGSFELVDREYTVGRAEDSDIRIDNPLVSRRHALIAYRDHAWRVDDLETPNGIYVNGEKVTGYSLSPGDQVQLGQHVLIFQGAGDEDFDITTQPGLVKPSLDLSDSPTRILPPDQMKNIQAKQQDRLGCHVAMQHGGQRMDFQLTEDLHRIGFDDDCDIRLPGSTLFGKKVAELLRKGSDSYAIVSLSSLAPVRVNGEKVSSRLLLDRDRIELKGHTLTFFRSINEQR